MTVREAMNQCMEKVGSFDPEKARLAKLQHLWDIILVWSGYEVGWYPEKEIARYFHISTSGLYKKLQEFKSLEPEAYKRVKADRARVRIIDSKIKRKLENPVSYSSKKHDIYIKEKF